MKKIISTCMVFVFLIGMTMTASAEDVAPQVVSGENYELTIPAEFRTYDRLQGAAELLINFIEGFQQYVTENPEKVDQYLIDNPEVAANLEKIQVYDLKSTERVSAWIEEYERNIAIFEKFQFEVNLASNIDLAEKEIKGISVLTSDLSQVEEVTAKYSAEEISELNLVDASKEEREIFVNSLKDAVIDYYERPSSGAPTVVETQELRLPSNNNVLLSKVVFTTQYSERIEFNTVMYATIVSGDLFLFFYTDNLAPMSPATTEAASSIINTLNFYEVDRADILGMEPATFLKVLVVIVILFIILIIVLLVVKSRKKKKTLKQQNTQFESGQQMNSDTNVNQMTQQQSEHFEQGQILFQQNGQFETNQDMKYGTSENQTMYRQNTQREVQNNQAMNDGANVDQMIQQNAQVQANQTMNYGADVNQMVQQPSQETKRQVENQDQFENPMQQQASNRTTPSSMDNND